MKTTLHGSLYDRHRPQTSSPSPWPARLQRFWETLSAQLVVSSEPHVWQAPNDAGQVTWNAYDVLTQQSIYDATEDELRVWLEELHYRDRAIA